jgi:hypothetical protein
MKQRLLKLFPFQRGVLNECAENSSCELFSESVYCLRLYSGILVDYSIVWLYMEGMNICVCLLKWKKCLKDCWWVFLVLESAGFMIVPDGIAKSCTIL